MIKIEKLNPFGRMCISLGMMPSSYKESLTYEEQLLWFMKYLEETVIPTVNNNADAVEELQALYLEIKTYVDDYFDNLDIQQEINTKLDEMATNGTLSNIINNEIFSDINNKILQNSIEIGTLSGEVSDAIKSDETNVITMGMLTQDVREALTGGSTAVVGVDSVNTVNIANNAVTIYKLDDLLQETFTKEFSDVSLGNSIDGNWKRVVDGAITNQTDANFQYFDVSLDNNTVYAFSGYNMFYAPGIIVYDPNDSDNIITYTEITDSSKAYDHKKLVFKTNKSGLKAYINKHIVDQNNGQYNLLVTLAKVEEITQNIKSNYVEKLRDIDNYLVTSSNVTGNSPRLKYNADVTCKTEIYKLSKGTKYLVNSANIYQNCGLAITNEKLETSYLSNNENVGSTAIPFSYEFTATNDGFALLQYIDSPFDVTSSIYVVEEANKYKSMKWTLIGDSLTDENSNPSVKKYYSYVQDDLHLVIQNLGASGSGYKNKTTGNNFVEQSLLVDNDSDVITIFGSFNDYEIYNVSGLGELSDTTTDTVFGCVYTTLNNLITERPNAKIGVILPTPMNYSHANPFNPTSINIEFIEGIKTIAKKFSIPVLDLFYESNTYPWDATFRSMFYVNSDGTHLNTEGNKRIAYQIEEFIKKLV